jgi:hypothetical protein
MTDTYHGTIGAKRQSWREANPRALLEALVAEHPDLSHSRLLKLFRERLQEPDGEDYIDVIVEYWFTNNIRSIRPAMSDEQRAERKNARKRTVAALATKVKAKIEARAKIVLLDMLMPNGKPLRDCSKADCKLSGGWLTRLADRMRPNELVGDRTSEEELQKLYSATRP